MELTTENIIKIALGVFVIVTVVLGVYFAMKFYIIPYFSGIGFDKEEIGVVGGVEGSAICEGKEIIGEFKIYNPGMMSYTNNFFFKLDGTRTEIYLNEDKKQMRKAVWGGDLDIGVVKNDIISIYDKYKEEKVILDGKSVEGNKICK